MRGTGIYAELLRKRFKIAYKRLGFDATPALDCEAFTPPMMVSCAFSSNLPFSRIR